MSALPDVLRALLTAPGPSGNEGRAAAVFRDACAAFAEVSWDTVGSTVARVPGRGEGPSVAIVGHIDEIGLTVSHIDDEGFLWFLPIGGWDPIILVGQRLTIVTRDGLVPGVVGRKPIHLMDGDDRKQVPKLRDLHIDIGASDGDEARAAVRVGDVAVIAGEPVELRNGRFASRSMDNRLGCYVAYETARLVHEAGGAAGDVFAVAAAQEETSFAGSTTTTYSLQPGIAITIDVTHATDVPEVSERDNGRHHFGSGPAIVRGTNLSPVVFELLAETAEAEGIPYTIEATGRSTGTDADATHMVRGGVPSASIGIPLRYMHSAVEMAQLDDIEATARLCAAFARRLTADVSLLR